VGRTHHIWPHGARVGVFLGVRGRPILDLSGTLRSFSVLASYGAHV
jgi:hypothetical protein